MDIPEAFWDWDFRRQRAWFFMVLPGAPYDKIEAGHGTVLAAAFGRLFPREFCNLAAAEQEAYLHWEAQVNAPRSWAGAMARDVWNQPSDRAQVATSIAAACREGMLQSLSSGAASIASFRDDARAFGGASALTAWARANPSGYNEDAEAWLLGRTVGRAVSASAYVYPAGQVARRRLHAPVRRARSRPRLSVNRTTSGRVTVTPVQTVRSTPSTATGPQPPQAPEGYVLPQPDLGSFMGPPIVVGTPRAQAPSPTPAPSTVPASFRPTEPTSIPSAGISPLWIVGGLAVVGVGGYLLLRRGRRGPDRSLNGSPR